MNSNMIFETVGGILLWACMFTAPPIIGVPALLFTAIKMYQSFQESNNE